MHRLYDKKDISKIYKYIYIAWNMPQNCVCIYICACVIYIYIYMICVNVYLYISINLWYMHISVRVYKCQRCQGNTQWIDWYTYIYIYKYDSIHMIDDSPFGSPLNPFCSENIPCQGSHHGFGVDGQPVHFFCPNGHISGVNTASVVESSSAWCPFKQTCCAAKAYWVYC